MAGMDRTAPPGQQREWSDARRWQALGVCLVALFMTLLDVSVVNVALPSIGRSTGAGPSQLQWVVSGYVLAFGLVPVLAGRLGDDRGRRTMFLIGVAGFVVSSAATGLAPTPAILLVSRFVQGLAGGLINPQVAGFIQDLFQGAKRARAFGTLGTTVGVATALGPVIGGGLIGLGGPEFGWRLVFFVNIPIGLLAIVLGRRLLPPPPPRSPGRGRPLDLVGVSMLGLATFLVLFPAVEYDSYRDARLGLLVVPAVLLLLGFLRWERRMAARQRFPLVDPALFRVRSYTAGVLLALIYFCSFTGLPLVLSLYFQFGLGYSALHSGLSVAAFAVGSALSATISGRLVPRFGRRLIVMALSLFAVGITVLEVLARLGGLGSGGLAGRADLALAPGLFLAGLGGGGVITPNQAISLSEVDARGGSTAAGALQTAQRIGSAIGSAVVGAMFFATLAAASGGGARAGGSGGSPGAGSGGSGGGGIASRLPSHDVGRYDLALANSLLVALGFVLLALLVAVLDVRSGTAHAGNGSAGGVSRAAKPGPGPEPSGAPSDAAATRPSSEPPRAGR